MAQNSKKLKIDSLEGNTFEDEYISTKEKEKFLTLVLACLQKVDNVSSISSPHIEDRQAGYDLIVTRAIEMAKVLLAKVK